MKNFWTNENMVIYIELFITLLLFIIVKDLSFVNSFSALIVALLEFVIILELIRMVIEFLFSNDHRVKLRFMIDSTIVFFIRDIMLIVNEKLDLAKVIAILGIIAILFVFRIITMKYSPSYLEQKYRDLVRK